MPKMTSRERIMAALRRETPDRVPWAEGGVNLDLQVQIMGTPDFEPGDLCRRLGLDTLGSSFPLKAFPDGSGVTGDHSAYYYPSNVRFDFGPPWIAEMGTGEGLDRSYVKKGLLTSRESLALFDQFLPDPDHSARYERVAEWIRQYRDDFAVFASLRLGTSSTLESMGLDVFGYMLYDDPDLIHEIHSRFSAWTIRVLKHLNEMDFDFFWFADDVAANNGPFMSPKAFRQFILPHMRAVAKEIKKPWIYHSDGDFYPLLPDLLKLGMSAIHPIQPSVMDIGRVKREFGDRVAIVGNIDLDYTLTQGSPEEVEAEVRDRIVTVGPGGGYLISSANSLTDYCKPENVVAMGAAIEKYGYYPLE